jgi:hypothetical protein
MGIRRVDYAGNTYSIANHHPIPQRFRSDRIRTCYRDALPYTQLRVGESFDTFPDDDDFNDVERCQNRVTFGFGQARAILGGDADFTSRQIHNEGPKPFVRCWRTA